MEPEVHIIEKYFQELLKCFTMTNIRCKRNKEIDLLAIDPRSLKRYHVESRVSTAFPLQLQETKTKMGKSHKNGLDYFAKEKFNHPSVLEKVKTIFGSSEYDKVLVVHSVKGMNYDAFNEKAWHTYGIQVWRIGGLIHMLRLTNFAGGSRDDVLRLIELLDFKERRKTKALVNKWNKKDKQLSEEISKIMLGNRDKNENTT